MIVKGGGEALLVHSANSIMRNNFEGSHALSPEFFVLKSQTTTTPRPCCAMLREGVGSLARSLLSRARSRGLIRS